MQKKTFFVLILILWIVILGTFIAYKQFTLTTGKKILLKTVPVDPRDIFRGDYIALRYEISTIDLDKIASDYKNFQEDDSIFITLKRSEKYWDVQSISKIKPETKSDEIFIKGVVKRNYNDILSIEYGIESYFVPEGKGKDIERRVRDISIEISVDNFGNAVIDRIFINDEPLAL